MTGVRERCRRTRRRARRAGFTLLELMIVVALIAVVSALAVPAITVALTDRKANQAALDVVRLARHARSSAAAYGRAYMMRFNSGSDGSFHLWRGLSNGCNTNDWSAITTGGCEGNDMCVDSAVMSEAYTTASAAVVMSAPNLGDTIDVCYEPTGIMEWRTATAGRFSDRNINGDGDSLQGGARLEFRPVRSETDEVIGVTRVVVLPLGGEARVVR